MSILVTGFEPFGGSAQNPTAHLVAQLAAAAPEGVELQTAVLPVDRYAGPDQLIRTLIKTQPQQVLCLGEAGGRAVVSVERVAVNLLDFDIADNQENQPVDEPIQPEGPAAYFATLPVRRMVAQLVAAGIPAQISLSAGTYLCNQVMYTVLHYIHKHRLPIQAGFVHLPQLPAQVAAAGVSRPSMSLELQEKGVRLLIELLASGKIDDPHKKRDAPQAGAHGDISGGEPDTV